MDFEAGQGKWEARFTRVMEELPLILAACFLLVHGVIWLLLLLGVPMAVMPDWMVRWLLWLVSGSALVLWRLWGGW